MVRAVARGAAAREPGHLAPARQAGDHGETELLLGFVFLAPDEAAAQQLIGFLGEETDYERRGALDGKGRKTEWVVAGVTQPAAVSLETINAWVEWMVAAGVANGPCAFDGWTAQARIEDRAAGDVEPAPETAPPVDG